MQQKNTIFQQDIEGKIKSRHLKVMKDLKKKDENVQDNQLKQQEK